MVVIQAIWVLLFFLLELIRTANSSLLYKPLEAVACSN